MRSLLKPTPKREESRAGNMPSLIADRIRLHITRGEFSPESHLNQTTLANMFSTSRVPVREALKLLAAEGIVLHDLNRGFFVASLSSEEARELYRIRHLVEVEILSTLAWPNDLQLKSLSRRVVEIEKLRNKNNIAEWLIHHRNFHEAVFGLSPRKFLVREALRYWRLADRYRSFLVTLPVHRLGIGNQSSDRQLLEALVERDRQRLLEVFVGVRTQITNALLSNLIDRGL